LTIPTLTFEKEFGIMTIDEQDVIDQDCDEDFLKI